MLQLPLLDAKACGQWIPSRSWICYRNTVLPVLTPHICSDSLQKAIRLLGEGHTCVLCRGEKTWISDLRGIRPVLQFTGDGNDLHGCSAADRIVGRAAAMLFVLAGVREVYADVMTEGAITVLRSNGIDCFCKQQVFVINNRTGDGPCPMEIAVAGIESPEDAVTAIRQALQRLNEKGQP